MSGGSSRLGWLSASLLWLGFVDKVAFAKRFGIGASQVSRDIRDVNILLVEKGHDVVVGSKGRILGQPATAPLVASSLGFEDVLPDVLDADSYTHIQVEQRVPPHPLTLRAVVRSIKEGRTLTCRYASTRSGVRRRVLRPHALVFVDGRLHARAFEQGAGFRDFVLSRMKDVVLGDEDGISVKHDDAEWNTMVDVVLKVVHQDEDVQDFLSQEIGIALGQQDRRIRVREALVSYVRPLYEGGRYGGQSSIEVSVEKVVVSCDSEGKQKG